VSSLNIGLLADSSIQLNNLQAIVKHTPFHVSSALLTRPDNLERLAEADVWVVRVDMEDECAQMFFDYLDNMNVTVIYDEAESYSSLDIEERAKRFSKKIDACVSQTKEDSIGLKRASYVWVLAASAGGVEAVMAFIKQVPEDIGNIAFIYVQHMDEYMADNLLKTIGRNTHWAVSYCTKPNIICEKSIYLVSPSSELEFSDIGVMTPTNTVWNGPYKPSVDHIVAKIWRHYGKNSGVIVFSGMGNDGAKTCPMIKHAGGQVWVQSLESCAVDSMPREVTNTDCVSFSGTPEQLAHHFANYNSRSIVSSKDKESSYE